jgi:hypothetical protein
LRQKRVAVVPLRRFRVDHSIITTFHKEGMQVHCSGFLKKKMDLCLTIERWMTSEPGQSIFYNCIAPTGSKSIYQPIKVEILSLKTEKAFMGNQTKCRKLHIGREPV